MAGEKYLIVLIGPTAVGKTDLSIDLALHYNTDIVSADSRQFYREMSIGTAKPPEDQLSQIPHHLINHLSVADNYSAGMYEADALKVLEQIYRQKDYAVLVGGSMMYVEAILEGFDQMPEVKPKVREKLTKLYDNYGIDPLRNILKEVDPKYYKEVDLHNHQRLMRAIEVCLSTGQTYSSYRKGKKVTRPFKIIKVGLMRDREELYERINQRVDQMMQEGLLDEVKNLSQYDGKNALEAPGYKELLAHLRGEIDLDVAIDLIKRNTRRYAKRQLTWYRKDESVEWFHPDEKEKITGYIDEKIGRTEQ